MIKINLYGAPGCGKSVLSSLLFAELKLKGYNTELVREFAKELVYQGYDMHNLKESDRIFILAEQMRRESILHGKVDFLITDSPVMIAAFYYNQPAAVALAKKLMVNTDKPSKEFHFYIIPSYDEENYEQYGRAHTHEESKKIDKDMISFLKNEGINVIEISGNPKERIETILKNILDDHESILFK